MAGAGVLRDLGPCQVIFKGSQLGENLKVTVKTSEDTAPVKTARTGSAPVDDIFIGSMFECEVQMTRTQLAELNVVLPGASGAGTSGAQMVIRSTVGVSMRDRAGILILKPMVGNVVSVNTSEWLTVFIASPKPDMEFAYDEQSQRVFKVVFKAYAVETAGTPSGTDVGWLWKIGA